MNDAPEVQRLREEIAKELYCRFAEDADLYGLDEVVENIQVPFLRAADAILRMIGKIPADDQETTWLDGRLHWLGRECRERAGFMRFVEVE